MSVGLIGSVIELPDVVDRVRVAMRNMLRSLCARFRHEVAIGLIGSAIVLVLWLIVGLNEGPRTNFTHWVNTVDGEIGNMGGRMKVPAVGFEPTA